MIPWYFHLLWEAMTLISVVTFYIFWWFDKLPTVETFGKLVDTVNSRGGNILILLLGTVMGTAATLRLFYYVIQLSVDGKVMQDNVFALMGLTFVSGTITGGFMGALLKTMTGDNSNGKPNE